MLTPSHKVAELIQNLFIYKITWTENLDFWPKLSIFDKNSTFDQKFDFWPKFRFLTRSLIFDQNFDFLNKISIFDQNFDFWPKFRFLTKISIFYQKFHFWPKFRFLTKSLIFNQNFHLWPKFWFLTKISIFVQNFDFWPTFFYQNFMLKTRQYVSRLLMLTPSHKVAELIQNLFIYKIILTWTQSRLLVNTKLRVSFGLPPFSACTGDECYIFNGKL